MVACIGADSNPRGAFEDLVNQFSTASMDAVQPYGAAGPNMPFAHVTQQFMAATGTVPEDFGRLCVAQRLNASHCDHALLGSPISMDDHLASWSCEERARQLRLPFARIRAVIERHNAYADDHLIVRGG